MGSMRRVLSLVFIAGCAAGAARCGKQTEPVPVTMPIAAPTLLDTFSGVVQPFGNFQYQFKVTVDSQVLITLTSVTTVAVAGDPNANPPVAAKPSVPVAYPLSVRIGQSSLTTLGLTCTSLKAVTATAGAAPQLTGQALSGTFCVDISDPNGTLPEPVNITVTIAHS